MEITTFVLAFLWAFYWPLLYVRLRDIIHFPYEMTVKKIIVSIVFGLLTAIFITLTGFSYTQEMLFLSIIISLTPLVLLLLLDRIPATHEKKLMALIVYLHIFWQLVPRITPMPLLIEIVCLIAVMVFMEVHRLIKIPQKKENPVITPLWTSP